MKVCCHYVNTDYTDLKQITSDPIHNDLPQLHKDRLQCGIGSKNIEVGRKEFNGVNFKKDLNAANGAV